MRENRCLSINGARGMGKSTLCRALLRSRVGRRAHRLIYDPMDEYGPCAVFTARSPAEVRAAGRAGRRVSVRVVPPDPLRDGPSCAVELVELAAWLGNATVVLDEAHDVARNGRCPPEIVRYAKT